MEQYNIAWYGRGELKQMSSVQDDVMKRMEHYVDQLTTGINSDVIITSSLIMSFLLYSSSGTTTYTDPKNYNCTNETDS